MNSQEAHKIASIQKLFRYDERLTYFLFHHMNPEIRLGTEELLSEAASLGRSDELLICAALDFWNGEGGWSLSMGLRSWDDDNVLAFVGAILYYREIDPVRLVVDEVC